MSRAVFALRPSLLLFASTSLAQPVFAQDVDSTKSRTTVSGAVTVTNNGISTVPSFTLGKPAAIFDVFIARSGFSLDPQIRYGLNGKPWSFIFWGRYKLVDREKFRMTVGGHPAVNFRTTTVSINQTQREVIVARRFLAGELYPSYSLSKNASVGAYYLYSRGFEEDVAKNSHFISLRFNVSKGLLSDRYFVQLSPQVYYLKADEPDGFYVYSGLTVGRRNFPISLGAAVNKVVQTRVPGSEDFLWNVSLTYSIR